jgi:hypothetical protein
VLQLIAMGCGWANRSAIDYAVARARAVVQQRLSQASRFALAPSCGIFAPCVGNNCLEERRELRHIAVGPSARNRLGIFTGLVPS